MTGEPEHEKSAVVAFVIILVLFFLLVIFGKAYAHSWYDAECCSGTDCEMMSVLFLPSDGRYWILPTGEKVLINNTRPSQDANFHWCRYPYAGRALIRPDNKPVCLYVPSGGT